LVKIPREIIYAKSAPPVPAIITPPPVIAPTLIAITPVATAIHRIPSFPQ
jgi:hypothetical protein